MRNLGRIIRNKRELQGLTLRDLGKICDIRFEQIGKIERNELKPTTEILIKIGNSLKIDFEYLELIEIEIMQMFDDFLNSQFYYEDNSSYFQTRIENKRNSYINSLEYPRIILIEYMIHITRDNLIQASAFEKVLESYCMNDSQFEAIYFQYKALILRKNNELNKSIDYFLKALNLNHDEKQSAMIYYHLCSTYKDNRNLLKAVESYQNAKSIFSKYCSYLREIHCDMLHASLYSVCHCYNDAMQKYEFVLKNVTQFDSQHFLEVSTLKNMIWSSIVHKQYEKSLELLDNYEYLFKDNELIVLYSIWCYYKTEQFNEASNMLKNNQWLNSNKEFKDKFHLFTLLVKAENSLPNEKTLNAAIKVYTSLNQYADDQILIFYLDIILDLLEKIKDETRQNYYLKIKISLLEK